MSRFPKEVSAVSMKIIKSLHDSQYFYQQFSNVHSAMEDFHYRFCQALLPMFLSGDELVLDEREFDSVLAMASVEYALQELQEEGSVLILGDSVVLLERESVGN